LILFELEVNAPKKVLLLPEFVIAELFPRAVLLFPEFCCNEAVPTAVLLL
jgi:hypothetical protein